MAQVSFVLKILFVCNSELRTRSFELNCYFFISFGDMFYIAARHYIGKRVVGVSRLFGVWSGETGKEDSTYT
jgi:hypothetical protein